MPDKEITDEELETQYLKAEKSIYNNLTQRAAAGEVLKPTELKMLRSLSEKFKKNKDTPDIFHTHGEAGKYLGISRRMVVYYVKRGLIRVENDGTITKKTLDDWMVKNKAEDDEIIRMDKDIKKSERDYRKSRAEREAMAVKILKEEYLLREEVEKAFTDRAFVLARGLLMMSRKLSTKIMAIKKPSIKKVGAVIDSEVHNLLDNYSKPIQIGKSSTNGDT